MKYLRLFLLSLSFLVFTGSVCSVYGEPLAKRDVSVALVSSTNVAAGIESVQYSAVVRNTGRRAINDVHLLLYSENADIRIFSKRNSVHQRIDGGHALISLAPGEIAHVPFFASVNREGGLTTLHAVVISPYDEIVENNHAMTTLLTHETRLALARDGVLAVEAESFTSQSGSSVAYDTDPRFTIPMWHINSDELPGSVVPDSDDSPSADASGAAYMEALPDVRVADDEAAVFGVTNFAEPAIGPEMYYRIYLDQVGDYFFFARARATTVQDNTFHIRLGTDSYYSKNLQERTVELCHPDGSWQWVSKTPSQCNAAGSISFKVNEPGYYRLYVSMGDDGAELDKLVLKAADNRLPTGTGPEPYMYGENHWVTIGLHMWSDDYDIVENSTFILKVAPYDERKSSEGIKNAHVVFDIGSSVLESSAGFTECKDSGQIVRCSLDGTRRAFNRTHYSLTLRALAEGELKVDAKIEGDVHPYFLADAQGTYKVYVNADSFGEGYIGDDYVGEGSADGASVGGGSFSLYLTGIVFVILASFRWVGRRRSIYLL